MIKDYMEEKKQSKTALLASLQFCRAKTVERQVQVSN